MKPYISFHANKQLISCVDDSAMLMFKLQYCKPWHPITSHSFKTYLIKRADLAFYEQYLQLLAVLAAEIVHAFF